MMRWKDKSLAFVGAVLFTFCLCGCPPVTTPGVSLRVVLLPVEAVTAGAMWKVDDGPWLDSNQEHEISKGEHVISFKDAAGWQTPVPITVTIDEDGRSDYAQLYSMTLLNAANQYLDGQAPIDDSADDLYAAFARHTDEQGYESASGALDAALADFVANGGNYLAIAARSSGLSSRLFDDDSVAQRRLSRLIEAGAKVKTLSSLSYSAENSRKNYVLFVNGIFTDNAAHFKSLFALKSRLAPFADEYDICCGGFWNENGYFDLAECTVQKILEWIELHATLPPLDATTARLCSELQGLLTMNKNVIVVPHSQGNFYVRQAIDSISETDRCAISVLEVASPASWMPVGLANHSRVDIEGDLVAGISGVNDDPFPYEGTWGIGDWFNAFCDNCLGQNSILLLNHHDFEGAYLQGQSQGAITTRIREFCAPRVTDFSINEASTSPSPTTVSLIFECIGDPTEYAASELPTFSGAQWHEYDRSGIVPFELSPGSGTKTVWLKVKKGECQESEPVAATVTIDGDTPAYLVIHVHNPEGVEIGSIISRHDGQFPTYDGYGIEVRDGNTSMGNGSSHMPIPLDPGHHVISVTFNGMHQAKAVDLVADQLSTLVFMYSRTQFDLDAALQSAASQGHVELAQEVTGYTSGDIACDETCSFRPSLIFSGHCICPETGTCSEFCESAHSRVEGRVDCDFTGQEADFSLYLAAEVFDAPAGTECWTWISGSEWLFGITSCWTYAGVSIVPPTYQSFNVWYVQSATSGCYPIVQLCGASCCNLIEGWTPLDGGAVQPCPGEHFTLAPADNSTGGWDEIRISPPNFQFPSCAAAITESETNPNPDPVSASFQGSVRNIRMSSVPYDTSGKGLK